MKTIFFAVISIYFVFTSGALSKQLQFKHKSQGPNLLALKAGEKYKSKFTTDGFLVGRFYFPFKYGSITGKDIKDSDVILDEYMMGFSFFGSLENTHLIGLHTSFFGESTQNSTVTGCSIALINHLKSMTGIGINLFLTENDASTGLLVGILNMDKDCEGACFSLFINQHSSCGLTGAGFLNIAEDMSGVQLGFGNKAGVLRGLQCGLLNKINDNSSTWNVQIGLLNKSNGRNIQIGLLNFCKDGFLPFFPFLNF